MKLKCNKCLELKPTNAFSVDRSKTRGYQYICKDCHNEYTRNVWYIKNKEKQKENSKNWKAQNRNRILATRYGVKECDIELLLNNSSTDCPICSRPMSKPHLDHNHSTGKIRDFICGRCNTMLGLAGENITVLLSAIEYIRKHTQVVQRTE